MKTTMMTMNRWKARMKRKVNGPQIRVHPPSIHSPTPASIPMSYQRMTMEALTITTIMKRNLTMTATTNQATTLQRKTRVWRRNKKYQRELLRQKKRARQRQIQKQRLSWKAESKEREKSRLKTNSREALRDTLRLSQRM